MDEIEEFWNFLKDKKYITKKSLPEFREEYKTEAYKGKVHKILERDNLQQHIPGQSAKKKEGSELESTTSDGSEQEGSTVSDAYDPNFNLDEFFSPSNVITEEMVDQPREEEIAVQETEIKQDIKDVEGKKGFDERKIATEKIQKVENLERIKNLQRIKEEQSQFFDTDKWEFTPEFQKELDYIDDAFTQRSSEEIIKDASEKYSKYGIVFESDMFGNNIIVKTLDGSKTVTIFPGDNTKLKSFIAANAQVPESIKEEDYITKAFNVKRSRNGILSNEDGSLSSIEMVNKDNIAFPTVFPKDLTKPITNKPEDWIVFDINKKGDLEKAMALAEERGELYKFDTNEEAEEFADGGWQEVNRSDLEGKEFFAERGLDYVKIMNGEKRMAELTNEIQFIEKELNMDRGEYNVDTGKIEGGYKPSEKVIKENPDIYLPDGTLRTDAREKLKELYQERSNLIDVIRSGDDDNKVTAAIEDYNLFLHKKFETLAKDAIKENEAITNEKKELYGAFAEWFPGLKPSDITAEKKQTLNENQLDFFNKWKQKIDAANFAAKQAADKFFLGETYLNEKTRKYISRDFSDDFIAVMSAANDGAQEGTAASTLLPLALGLDINKKYTKEEIAQAMNNMSVTESRAFSRFTNSVSWKDWGEAIASSPFEVIGCLSANCLSMMVPIGLEIISDPKLLALSAGPGAAIGFARGGPKGAVFGAGTQLVSSVGLAMELTSSIMQEARNKEYNLKDSEQVALALQDEEVIRKGTEMGWKRGGMIFAADLFTGQLAGKLFTTSRTANRMTKTGAFIAERVVYDPLAESFGEFLAQVASGEDLALKEIINEGLGHIGSKAPNAALNIYKSTNQFGKINLAYELTDPTILANEKGSFEEISKWTGRMKNLKQIDESVAGAIQENLELREEAKNLLDLSEGKKSNKVLARTMQLLNAQKTLNKNENAKRIYKDELASIDSELSYMVREGKLVAEENMTNIDNIKDSSGKVVPMQKKVKSYSINGKRYNKAGFERKFNRMSDAQKKKASFEIKNDESFKSKIKEEYGVVPTKVAEEIIGVTEGGGSETKIGEPIVRQTYKTMEEVPSEIKDAAMVVKETAIEVEYKDADGNTKTETYESEEAIPAEIKDNKSTEFKSVFEVEYKDKDGNVQTKEYKEDEVSEADAVITQLSDGSVNVEYKEDKVVVAAPLKTDPKPYDSKDAIPQNIKDAPSTVITETDDGKFSVTYKESEVLGVTLEGKKKEAPKKKAVKGDEVSQSRIDELEDQVISDYMNEFNISEEEAMTKYLTEPLPEKYNELKSLMSERDKVESKLEKRYVDLINKSIDRLNISPETKNSIKEALFILNDKLQLGVTFDQILSFLSDKKSTQKLFDIIAKNELKAQGLDYDEVMGPDSGWSNKKKNDYNKSVAKKVEKLKNDISKGLVDSKTKPSKPKLETKREAQAKKKAKPKTTQAKETVEEQTKPVEPAKETKKEQAQEKKEQGEIDALQEEMEYAEGQIEEFNEEIKNTKENFKEDKAKIIEEKKKKIKELQAKKKKAKTKAAKEKIDEEIQDVKDQAESDIEDAMDERDGYIEGYKDDISIEKAEIRKAKKAIAKIEKKRAERKAKSEQKTTEAKKDVLKQKATDKTLYQRFVEKLSKAFPGVEVVTSPKEFNALIKDLNAKKLLTKNNKIYGAIYEGKLYLNPNLQNFNTPVHEFGHIWLNTAKVLKKELYEKGIGLIKDSDYIKQVKGNKAYQQVIKQMKKDGATKAEIDQYTYEEALATAIGDKGQSFVAESQKNNFKTWLTDLFNLVKKLTGISKLTAAEVQNLNLDEFLQGVVVDIMSENPLFKKAELSNFSNEIQLMASDGTKLTMEQIVSIGRQEGFSDSAIKEYLKSQGYKTTEVNEAMAVNVDMFTQMPADFINVFDNLEDGIKMFNEIKDKLSNWVKTKWGKGKSFSEYREKAMELLLNNETFKKQSQINQERLISGLDTFIGRKPAKDAAAPIVSMQNTIKLLKENNWEGNLVQLQKTLESALGPILRSKLHKENAAKIKKLIKGIKNKKNFDKNFKEIDKILTEIISEDKEITRKTNSDLTKLKQKISTFNKLSDYVKMSTEGSAVIQEIKTIARALAKNIGQENKDIVDRIIKATDGIKNKNGGQRIADLVSALNDLFAKEKLKSKETAQLVQTVKSLREKIQTRKEQANKLAEIKNKLYRQIKEATIALRDLGIKDYRYTDVQRLISKVEKATINNIAEKTQEVVKILSDAKERGRKSKLAKVKAFINNYAKTRKRKGRRISARAISAEGQEFFEAAKNFQAFAKGKSVAEINKLLQLREQLKEYTSKERNDFLKGNEQIKKALKELDKIFQRESTNELIAVVPEYIMGMDTMTLEQLNDLEDNLKQKRVKFASYLAAKKAIEKEERDLRNKQSSEQLQKDYPMMYKDETVEVDGEKRTVKTTKNSDEIKAVETKSSVVFKNEGFKKMIQGLKDKIKLGSPIVNFIGHLGTICNSLDNIPAGRNFFTENVYKRLNRAINRFYKGLQSQKKKMDDFAASINPNYNYDKIKKQIHGRPKLNIKGLSEEFKNMGGDQQLRLYALWQNDVQRSKLEKQGITKDVMNIIEANLGTELTTFADMVIDYLSNDNYNQINNVYKDLNNVNLPKIDNYFPTKTIHENDKTIKAAVSSLESYSESNFTAQSESFLKDRTDTEGKIAMMQYPNVPYTFTAELDAHFDSAERVKAFAKDAKILNSIFASKDVSNVIGATGLKKLMNQFINNTINPISSEGSKWKDFTKRAFSNFVGVKLAFKLWQIPKQASSFVWGLPSYELKSTSKLEGLPKLVANIVPFLFDVVVGMFSFKEAYNKSPLFRERINRFRKSGFSALETTITEKEAKNALLKWFNLAKKAGESETFVGDILGVLGYWAVYKRDIKNGMDPAKAMEKFEDYNKTQQTQRNTEINRWQLQSRENPMWLALTTFASTPFLMLNMMSQSINNINKQIAAVSGLKKPGAAIKALFGSKDGLNLIFALGVANFTFASVSYSMKLAFGDEEDQADFIEELLKAASGFNNLLVLPLIGQAIQLTEVAIGGGSTYGKSDTINPVAELIKEIGKVMKDDDRSFLKNILNPKKDEMDHWTNVLFKYGTGINTDPFIGLYEYLNGVERAGYRALGIPKSQQEKEQKSIFSSGGLKIKSSGMPKIKK